MSNNRSVAQLVEDVKNGDEVAFKTLFDRYRNLIFGCAWSKGHNHEDALDISQEACVAIWKGLRTFEYRDERQFEGWLKVVTRRIAVRYCQTRDGRLEQIFSDAAFEEKLPLMGIPDDIQTPEGAVIEEETTGLIHQGINGLPKRQREVMTLRCLKHLKIKEIADVLGLAEGTVKAISHQATRNLRDALGAV